MAYKARWYSHNFRNDLAKDPADIPPFELQVDMEKWRNPKNRGLHVCSLLLIKRRRLGRLISS